VVVSHSMGHTCMECSSPIPAKRLVSALYQRLEMLPHVRTPPCICTVLYTAHSIADDPTAQTSSAGPDYLFLVCLYVKRFRVLSCQHGPLVPESRQTYAENSPSLCPTISSVILTSV